jgi:nucleoid-associated protein YgaU
MVSPQLDAPTSSPASATLLAEPPVARPAAGRLRPVAARTPGLPARELSVRTLGSTRRDPVRPGARSVRLEGLDAVRPGRGGPAGDVRVQVCGGRVEDSSPPLRLTARGRRAVAGLSVAIGLSLAAVTVVGVELDRGSGLELAGADTVVVRSGDTLWSIARDVAPEEDPRGVVDAIVELNGLQDVDLLPGARLQLP